MYCTFIDNVIYQTYVKNVLFMDIISLRYYIYVITESIVIKLLSVRNNLLHNKTAIDMLHNSSEFNICYLYKPS